MKLVTTYAALDLLGPAYTWKTTAWIDSTPADGVLNGNLYFRGSGDPRFAIEHLWALLRQLRLRGIQQIAGDIVLDRTAFNVPAIDPGAFDDKPMRPYNVGPDSLLINFRALRFTLLPDSGKPRLLQETPSEGLRVDNQLRAGEGACGSNWKDLITTRLIPENNGNRLEFTGTYSALCGEKTLNLSPLPADAQAGGLIRSLWKELGGTLAGQIRGGTVPIGSKLLVQHESAPLADAVRDINKYSNNVMARQVFLTLGNDTAPATAERSRQRIGDWLNGRGLRFADLVLDNGSGLSRLERISAGNLNRLLLDAWKNPVMPEFISSLPIVGIDGTMKKRLKESEASGRAHIKTGTLDGVKTAAGYALDAQGRRYVVSFLINHPRAQAGSAAIDALLLWVAQRQAGEKSVQLENE
jgi:D-alanyl-D-alanine carboxypeptidase/D-alanyl-D-alanine-endopeptidase (penicillin-binding protein 4)